MAWRTPRLLAAIMLATAMPAAAAPRPNIVLLVVDDVAREDVERMPRLQQTLILSGTEFTRFATPNALCGPSRVSILRGQYSHNTGVTSNQRVFAHAHALGLESSTVATWLRDVGYATGLFGKYLNAYGRKNAPVGPEYVPPGWTEWYGGIPGMSFGFWLSHNGKLVKYPEDGPHANDVLAELAVGFIDRHADGPMFLYIAPGSSHGEAVPARRHQSAFQDAELPRRPSFNERDVSDKPEWIRRLPDLAIAQRPQALQRYRNRLRSLLSVEDLVAAVMNALHSRGLLERTYFIFVSDNGFHYGEHRIRESKASPYDEAVLVPAAIRGPGIPPGERIEHLATNGDLSVTIAEWAGAATPEFVDGRSLVPLLRRDRPSPSAWREAIPIERLDPRKKGDGPAPPFFGLRHNRWKYVSYPRTGEEELYDLVRDPLELDSVHSAPDLPCLDVLRAWARELVRCSGQECRDLERRLPTARRSCEQEPRPIVPGLRAWSPSGSFSAEAFARLEDLDCASATGGSRFSAQR